MAEKVMVQVTIDADLVRRYRQSRFSLIRAVHVLGNDDIDDALFGVLKDASHFAEQDLARAVDAACALPLADGAVEKLFECPTCLTPAGIRVPAETPLLDVYPAERLHKCEGCFDVLVIFADGLRLAQ